MKTAASLALALLAATAFAQSSDQNRTQGQSSDKSSRSAATFADPANLMGERVKPRDGRELPIDQGASGLQQLLRRLNTRASILNIVAHPDDEDGGMLTFYSRGLGARVADVSLTRGEGGQNAVTGDFEDALGLLRTQELLASDRYPGIDQFFGTEVDFGFSKTKEEAFTKWTHDRVLYDVVRAIRLYRPLVLTATFIGGVTDGHGQHQVSGEIAQEAFVKAGDPKVFPEMIAEGILPWSPLKVFARVPMQSITDRGLYDYATGQYTPAKFTNYVTGDVSTTPPSTDVIVHEGQTDPLLTLAAANPSDVQDTSARPGDQLSYVQFARIGLGLQKSQIGGNVRNAPPGRFDVAYHLYGSRLCTSPAMPDNAVTLSLVKGQCVPPATAPTVASNTSAEQASFFDGIDTSVLSLQETHTFPTDLIQQLAGDLDTALKQFDPVHPESIAPLLADALRIDNDLIRFAESSNSDPIEKANALHELRTKRVQLNAALALAYSLNLDATAPNPSIVQGLDAPVFLRASASEASGCMLQQAWLETAARSAGRAVESGTPGTRALSSTPLAISVMLSPANTSTVTRPYFDRRNVEQPIYDLREPSLRNAPQSITGATAHAQILCGSAQIHISRIVHFEDQAVLVVPALSLSLSPATQVARAGERSFELTVHDDSLTSYAGFKSLCLAAHCFAEPFKQGTKPTDRVFTIPVTELSTASSMVQAAGFNRLIPGGKERPAEGYRTIGYGDLPRTNFYATAETRIVPIDLKLPTRHRIAYLSGTGDAVPEALASIGLAPTMLTVADLTLTGLAQYDTIILGVRTYAAHPDLHGAPTQALIDFAKAGGNVVVQYQTTEFTGNDAPYPLALGSNEKVVDETDPVRLIDTRTDPGVRLFYAPNHITPADFDRWIEERGHGFLSTWDPRYSTPTETHDPGQNPQRGGLVTVKLGDDPKHQGRWTYCAFALYRQLPEAVPGAYRFFMNLIDPD